MPVTYRPPLDLAGIQRELTAAGIPLGPAGAPALGAYDDVVHTYDDAGAVVDLPPEAQPIVDAHDATPRAASVERQADTERLLLVNERAQTDPAFAALAELALRGVTTTGGTS